MKLLFFCVTICFATIAMAQQPTLIIPDGHASPINNNIIVDKQGKYVYTAETNKCIMWEARTGRQLYTFPLPYASYGDGYVGIDINADGSRVVITSGGFIFLYNTITGKKIAESLNIICSDLKFSEEK